MHIFFSWRFHRTDRKFPRGKGKQSKTFVQTFWMQNSTFASGHWPRGSTGRRLVRKKKPSSGSFFLVLSHQIWWKSILGIRFHNVEVAREAPMNNIIPIQIHFFLLCADWDAAHRNAMDFYQSKSNIFCCTLIRQINDKHSTRELDRNGNRLKLLKFSIQSCSLDFCQALKIWIWNFRNQIASVPGRRTNANKK